jgi:phage terminase large subunit-like protein
VVEVKKLLIVAALALTSCAPILGTVQGTASTLTQTGQTLTLTNRDSTPLGRAVVAVDGPAGVTGAVCSMPVDGLSYCRLDDVFPNASAVLTYTGKLKAANASWRTPAGRIQGTVWP